MLSLELVLAPDLADLARGRPAPGPDGAVRLLRRLPAPAALKDVIQAAGVPRCELGAVRDTGGGILALDTPAIDGQILHLAAAEPRPAGDARFLCDQHLGRLARLLRAMGLDTAWQGDWLEPEVARRGANEGRIVLSRSRPLLMRRSLARAQLIRSDRPDEQAAEAVRRWQLRALLAPFGRCGACNGLIETVPKAAVAARIPPRTALWLDDYYRCRDCGRLYWRGTHVTALEARIAAILGKE